MQRERAGAAPRWNRASTLTAAALLAVALAAWLELVRQATSTGEPAMDRSLVAHGAMYVGLWAVMMAAMMLPSAVPMIGLYAAVHRLRAEASAALPTALFAAVYWLVWAATGVVVFAARAVLRALVPGELMPYGVALVLVAAGIYQLTPLKRACLSNCRGALGFLIRNWRPGYVGTFRLALLHAGYCVACCWALMAVLVVAGMMELLWVLVIAALIAGEKLLPRAERIAAAVGIMFLAIGLAAAARPELAAMLRGGPA